MSQLDLTPATSALADVIRHLRDDDLGGPTPCPDYTVRGILGHVHGLSLAFAAAASKDLGPLTSEPPKPGAQGLPDDWREATPAALAAMAQAWQDPEAWTGMTAAGGVDLPGEVAGLVALDEVVIHGWDIARSTGQTFDPGPGAVDAVFGFLTESRKGPVDAALFGPAVEVGSGAPPLDRAVGLAGRDPSWTP